MNIFGVILLGSAILFFSFVGIYMLTKHRSQLGWVPLFVAVLITLFIINNFVYRIPNQFELRDAVMSRDRMPPKSNAAPLSIPNTNADPSAAYTHERELLDKARGQQER